MAVGRFLIENAFDLRFEGLLGYMQGKVITVDEGSLRTFRVYNSNRFGSTISFKVSMSLSSILLVGVGLGVVLI